LRPKTAPPDRSAILDFVLIFLLTAALIWPLFKLKYADKWASIESTFISDARFLKEHWPHPQWQPLWYGGTRFDYVYPPALRYGTAALARYYPRMTEARAYHLYTAFFYCVGIAAVYLLVRVGSGSRAAAWAAAAGAALLSPSFLLIEEVRNDAMWRTPLRLGALVRYGEGPHMTALALLPLALAASFHALRERRPPALAAAAILCALVVSNNFYGATALAISFPVLAWSVWITHGSRGLFLRAAMIPLLAYGLTAFWLVPSYLRVTTANLRLVSQPGNTWSVWLALLAAVLYMAATASFARARRDAFWAVFTAGLLLFVGLNVLGNYFFGFRVAGEPGRLIPELDLAIILAGVELLRRLANLPPLGTRAAAAALFFGSLAAAHPYVRHAWDIFPEDPNFTSRVEYKLTEWMARNLPDSRALATGSVRFWYNAWRDLPQLGGGSEQGTLNQIVNLAYTQITNDSLELAILWSQAFGLDALIVHGKDSKELYHDYVYPEHFAGKLPVLYDNREGDVVYRVPRRFPGLARVVETASVSGLPLIGPQGDAAALRRYVDALEKGPNAPAAFRWEGTDRMRVRATTAPGQSVIVQVAYDPQWVAKSSGLYLPVAKDALGQMRIDPPAGTHDIEIDFETPLESTVGRYLTALAAMAVVGLLAAGERPAA
jgi:hypothetical protein